MERKEFLEKVLAYGRQAGFADCEVYYRGGKAFEVLILEGEVSDYENSREEGLAFRGNINGRTGYAYTEQLTEDAIAYLVETAKEAGLYTIQWDVDSLDWKNLSGQEIALRVVNGVKSGSIILCHNNGLHTAEALPVILSALKNKGYRFVPIGELIYRENYSMRSDGRQMPAS
mgnify:CR=1 FL=1